MEPDQFTVVYKKFLDTSQQSGHFGVFTFDRPNIPLPLHVNWTKLNAIGYILKQTLNENTEDIIKKCIHNNISVNSENRCVPGLTVVLLHGYENTENYKLILKIMQLLLENGGDPCYISRNTCIRPETVPDAMIMAAYVDCEPALKLLLQHWWPAPLAILDSWLGNHTKHFTRWFPMLCEYGWLHGSLVAEVTEEYVSSMIESSNNSQLWASYQQTIRQPCTLKRLSRLVIRQHMAVKSKEMNVNFMSQLKKCEVPTTVISFLLMEFP
jgi:hypothetical protein